MSTEQDAGVNYTDDLAQYSAQIQDKETVCNTLDSLLPHFENMRGYRWCHRLITDRNKQARVIIEKAASKLKEVTSLSEALGKEADGRFGALQRETIRDKLDVEIGVMREGRRVLQSEGMTWKG